MIRELRGKEGRIQTADANVITTLATAAGIVFGFLGTHWFARRQEASATAKHEDQKAYLKGTIDDLTQRLLERGDTSEGLAIVSTAVRPDSASRRSQSDNGSRSTIVRAKLGPLLDEKGQVEAPRLIREVNRALGTSGFTDVNAELAKLRREGVISWDGDGVTDQSVIRVHGSTT